VSERTGGAFIVLEGIDGSGSTTQARRLCDRLNHRGHEAVATQEPSSGPIGVLIREVLQHKVVVAGAEGSPDWSAMALLFAADRVEHTRRVIEPALARGDIVVSDRYTLSSLTYQSLTAPAGSRGLEWLRAINARALVPNLVIVIDTPAAVAAQRRARRGADAELFEVDALQSRLAEAYLEAESYLGLAGNVLHVDGNRPVEAVFEDVERAADRLLRSLGVVSDATGR
jgi:dTMP kinase